MGRSSIIPVLFTAAIAVALTFCSCTDEPSGPAPPTAPDTTSHEFTWEITQIGVRHTAIYDVEAITHDDVWICGEIHFENTGEYDSLGNIIKPFNLAHWDGYEWEFTRMLWPGESLIYGFTAISSIKAFAHDDIWFNCGRKIAHLKGSKYEYWELPYEQSAGDLMDGTPDNLYFAGSDGRLMHYDGRSFTMMNSGTDKDIQDMWTVGSNTLLVCSNSIWGPAYPTLILKIEKGSVAHWEDSAMYKGMTGIWFTDTDNVFIAGPGLRSFQLGKWTTQHLPHNAFLTQVRGTGLNDIFVCGHVGSIQHFNGASWKSYSDAIQWDKDIDGYLKLAYIKDNVYLSGYDAAGRSVFVHGQRRE